MNIFAKVIAGVGDFIATYEEGPGAPLWLRNLRDRSWSTDGSRFSHDAAREWGNYVGTEKQYRSDPLSFASRPIMLKIRGMFARATKVGVNYYSYEQPPVLDNWGQPVLNRDGTPVLRPEVIVKHRFTDHGAGVAMRDGRDLDPRVVRAALHTAYIKNGQQPLQNVYGSPQYRRLVYACAMEMGIVIKSREFHRFAYEAHAYQRHQAVDQALGMNLS